MVFIAGYCRWWDAKKLFISQGIYFGIYHTKEVTMTQTAKLFVNGRSQAVRLPAAFRFDTSEVFIHKDAVTGDVILSRRPSDWDGFLVAAQSAQVSADFLSSAERLEQGHAPSVDRDPFDMATNPLEA
jgi:antitoxin VapB